MVFDHTNPARRTPAGESFITALRLATPDTGLKQLSAKARPDATPDDCPEIKLTAFFLGFTV